MTNALTILTPNDILTTAKALINSGFLPKSVDTVDKAFAIITMSQDLGIGMWQGLNGINVIQGKPTVSPQLMLALINRSGQLEDMQIETTADFARVTLKRKGRTAHTETFTIKDASAQGLTSKDNYRKQPATMLKWRAVAAAARVVFPDAIMGFYTVEEIAPDAVTINDDGEATYTAPVTVERPTEPAPETLTGKLTHITRGIVEKTGKSYYRFNGGVFTFTRQPFRDAGLTVCETWADLPINETFDMPDGVNATVRQVGNDRYEIVSVEVKS